MYHGRFNIVHHVGFDDFPRDRQSRVLRVVVNVAVAGIAELLVLLGKEPHAQVGRKTVARLDAN